LKRAKEIIWMIYSLYIAIRIALSIQRNDTAPKGKAEGELSET